MKHLQKVVEWKSARVRLRACKSHAKVRGKYRKLYRIFTLGRLKKHPVCRLLIIPRTMTMRSDYHSSIRKDGTRWYRWFLRLEELFKVVWLTAFQCMVVRSKEPCSSGTRSGSFARNELLKFMTPTGQNLRKECITILSVKKFRT